MGDEVLPYGHQTIEDDDIAAVTAALKADFLTTGPTVDAFEQAFAEAVGARHAVACANGTAALHLAMLALLAAAAAEAGAVLVEDAPHALGSTMSYGNVAERAGDARHSAMATFSFHPVKTIATGEGGMVTTNDAALAGRLRTLRSHGMV